MVRLKFCRIPVRSLFDAMENNKKGMQRKPEPQLSEKELKKKMKMEKKEKKESEKREKKEQKKNKCNISSIV